MKATFQRDEHLQEVETRPGERLLYCGLNNGIPLSYECGTGTCGTCKAAIEKGKVRELWPDAPGMRYVKRERGEVLLCQSAALEDVHVRIRPAPRTPTALPAPTYIEGTIHEQKSVAPDVVEFSCVLNSPIRHLAGQFVVLKHDGLNGYRAYSMIDSAADDTDMLRFVVKRIADGKFTEWLFEQSRVGESLSGFGPLGRAVAAPETDGDMVALAGGTGIAGIMAIIKWAAESGHLADHGFKLVFGLNRPQDAFFLHRLNGLCERWSGMDVTVAFLEMEGVERLKSECGRLKFAQGYLHDVGRDSLDDLSDVTTAFLAGPTPAVEASLKLLAAEKRFSPSKIRYDKFS